MVAMSDLQFDCCVADAILGRIEGLRLPQVCELYGVPSTDQLSALKEIVYFDARLRVRRPKSVADLATSL
jgi:hypothetical protein